MARLNDHIVICNWGENATDLVRTLHSDMFIQNNNQKDWRPIVVVAENVTEFPDEPAFRGTMLLPGCPTRPSLLERANIVDAYAVVVMADDTAHDMDDRTIMTAINVNSVLKSAEMAGQEPHHRPRIIVEMMNPDRAALFKSEGSSLVDEVVCRSDLNIQVVAQSNILPGLTHVLRELLDFSEDTDEFYMIEVPKGWDGLKVAAEGFFPLVRWIGEQSRLHETNGESRATILIGYVQQGADGREMRINPKRKEFREHPIKAGDALILIARRRGVALRVLEFRVDECPQPEKGMEAVG